jgi:hypothetical protein
VFQEQHRLIVSTQVKLVIDEICNRPITRNRVVSCNRNSKKHDYKFHFCNFGAIRTNDYEFSITSFKETRNLGVR